MPQEISEAYIRDYAKRRGYEELSKERIEKLRKAMEKYNEKWWELKDPTEVAKYQIFEDTLLVDLDTFHKGLENLLKRPVYTHEMILNLEGLREEAREAIKRRKRGESLDEKIATEREKRGILTLLEYAKNTGKSVTILEIYNEKK